ncbi:MAG: helicase-related protein [Halanaerobiales bacterium]|nr:helicase-related protein [Halanaerobiales bacterium]
MVNIVQKILKQLNTHKRTNLILKHYKNLADKKTLGFCASIQHAKYMAKKFNENNIKAVCVHSASNKENFFMERNKAIQNLEDGNINVIFAVDIFNEGVDIPSLNTVLFLRPTESYTVFLQQLGRGLRKSENKDYLKVLDFIGNYKRAHYIPYLLSGENPMKKSNKDLAKIDEFDFPENCHINFDFKTIDLFKEMAKSDPLIKRMEEEYFRLKNYLGKRPLRKDIYDGVDIDIKEYLKGRYTNKKGYLRYLNSINELNNIEKKWLDTIIEDFLIELENTRMSKAYKIPVLLSLIKDNKLKMTVDVKEVGETYMNFYKYNKLHQKDFNNKKHRNWKNWIRKNI